MFEILVDPALLFPPALTDLRSTEWAVRVRQWTTLVGHEAMTPSCPTVLTQKAAAIWWEERDSIVAALEDEDGPLAHGELTRLAEELRARLGESPLNDEHQVVMTSVALSPEYGASALTPQEQEEFRHHIGELGLQRQMHPGCTAVATERESWADDPAEIVIEAKIGLWTIGSVEQELNEESESVREHVRGCCVPHELFAALLRYPEALVAYPRLGVEAYVASVLREDPEKPEFRIGRDFVSSLKGMNYTHEPGRAKTCWRAMAYIATGRAAEVGGLNAHPVKTGDGSGAPAIKDDAGRSLMRGYLAQHSANAHRLHWWAGARPEFVSVGGHDHMPV